MSDQPDLLHTEPTPMPPLEAARERFERALAEYAQYDTLAPMPVSVLDEVSDAKRELRALETAEAARRRAGQ